MWIDRKCPRFERGIEPITISQIIVLFSNTPVRYMPRLVLVQGHGLLHDCLAKYKSQHWTHFTTKIDHLQRLR